jgi:XTP/dITP diphosphohydrolase
MKQLLLATRNLHKIAEMRSFLSDVEAELVTLDDFPHVPETSEDGETLEENALKKAREASRQTNLPALADDSGLEVYYLNNEPGVFSSRYAGPHATYSDNCRKLLVRLRGVPQRRRSARFRCVLAFVVPEGTGRNAEGICRGIITEEPRGTKGFGYDPVFVPDRQKLTFAEMDSYLKNTLSHRAKAFEIMRDEVKAFFGSRGNIHGTHYEVPKLKFPSVRFF